MIKQLISMVLAMVTSSLLAQTASDEVQARLNAIHTMSANFTQIVKAGKREVSNSYGVMALARPGRFRWQTKSPLEQLIVADGKQLWVYDVDLEQVTVRKQDKGVGGTPALFLSGYDNTVARDFTVTASQTGNRYTYRMHAKSPKENYQDLTLIFNKDMLTQIEFFDQLGQHTIVHLTHIKHNPSLSTQLFQFKAPAGVDMIKQ